MTDFPPPPPPPPGGPPSPPPGYGAPPSGFGGPPPGYGYLPPGVDAPSQGFAGFGARLGGYLLDGLLYGLLAAVFLIPATVFGVAAFDDCVAIENADGTVEDIVCPPGAPDGGLLAAGIALGVVGVIVVAVVYLRALGRTGQTWGRKIVGIRVVSKETGQPIGFGRALGRQLFAGFISANVCYLGYLWMLWQPQRQTWHDLVVGTVVVRDQR